MVISKLPLLNWPQSSRAIDAFALICGLLYSDVVFSYLFWNEDGRNATVNENSRAMLIEFLWSDLVTDVVKKGKRNISNFKFDLPKKKFRIISQTKL